MTRVLTSDAFLHLRQCISRRAKLALVVPGFTLIVQRYAQIHLSPDGTFFIRETRDAVL